MEEGKFNYTVDKIEEVSHDVDMYKANTDIKVSEIENNFKMEIQSIQNTVNIVDKHSVQFECLSVIISLFLLNKV